MREARETAPKATNGRSLKAKGIATRKAILEALEAQVRSRRYVDINVTDIAEQASVSMATFYIYFSSLEDAVLALVSSSKFRYPTLMQLLGKSWDKGNILSNCRTFVKVYYAFWQENLEVLRLRNQWADSGDQRFIDCRFSIVLPIINLLAEKIAVAKRDGNIPAHVPANSYSAFFIASLERSSMTYMNTNLNSREDLEEAAAVVLTSWLAPDELMNQDK